MDSALPRPRSGRRKPEETQRVSNFFPASPGGWGKARPWLSLLAGLLMAHDTLGACVQHTVQLAVGAQHIDVRLDLTFFEQWSASERATMDADGNGAITRPEQEAYLKRIGAGLCKQVKLFVAGRELPLAPLYDPELDLLGNKRVGPAHHRLRLFFFVTTPAGLRAGEEIVVEDKLWPEAEMLATPRAEGRDGCRLATGLPTDAELLPGKAEPPRRIRFKCLQPPSTKPAAHSGEPTQYNHRWTQIHPDKNYSNPHFCMAGVRSPEGEPKQSEAAPESDSKNLCPSVFICGAFRQGFTASTTRSAL
jgi:hypothetical protein